MDKLFIPIRLRAARKVSGLSLGQLVDKAKLQVTRQSIFNYERGVMQPKPATVKIFADTFGVSEFYFYGTSTTVDVPMLRSGSDGLLTEEELYELETKVCFPGRTLYAYGGEGRRYARILQSDVSHYCFYSRRCYHGSQPFA